MAVMGSGTLLGEQQSETFLGDKSDALITVNKGKDRKRGLHRHARHV